MDERSLLLLGMLKAQSQHGYQLNEFIEKNLSCVIAMKRSTAYSILDRLSDAGYVAVTTEQEGNRPPRKVYALTESGNVKFYELLRDNLSQADDLSFSIDIGLMFIDHLPAEEVVRCLQSRLRQVDQQAELYTNTSPHGHGSAVDLAMQHRIALYNAERTWLQGVIEQLQAHAGLK